MDLATLRHMTEPSSTLSLVQAAFPGTEIVGNFSGGKEAW